MNQPFEREVSEIISANASDGALTRASRDWMEESIRCRYSYCFRWLGRPIIQYPQDMVAIQEIIWRVRPDLIIETGIAHGGSLVMSASILALLEICDAAASGQQVDPRKPLRTVLGVDIDIREHNRAALVSHPLASRIELIQGSSVDQEVVRRVQARARESRSVLVLLDSNHTHEHVLAELEAYGPLVTPGSYCVVFDTVIEDLPDEFFPDRPWGRGDNPKTAVHRFVREHPEFEIDRQIPDKLQLTVAHDGYLRRKP
jgi:cephalosporin hydroxylase